MSPRDAPSWGRVDRLECSDRRFGLQKSNSKQKPFFVRFLEGGEPPRVKTGVKAGQLTHKYPSNRDEGI
jgi:hypothetical protein